MVWVLTVPPWAPSLSLLQLTFLPPAQPSRQLYTLFTHLPPTAQFDLCKRAVAQSVNGRHCGYNSQSFYQVPCDYACWHCDGDKFPSPNTECRRVSIVSDLGAAIRELRVGWFSASPWIYIPYNGTWNVSHFPWKLEFHVVLLHGT